MNKHPLMCAFKAQKEQNPALSPASRVLFLAVGNRVGNPNNKQNREPHELKDRPRSRTMIGSGVIRLADHLHQRHRVREALENRIEKAGVPQVHESSSLLADQGRPANRFPNRARTPRTLENKENCAYHDLAGEGRTGVGGSHAED
ncbi:hypothetical protein B296_00025257 [Ensete ventricosum]|uniref:Uncharacterized protein n=1 Tax=Ensete ventricosum TaxID=4639 RepID=A0A426ZQ36_ENSVE|nr:hypothetical protein B296_00025257 [Ensete ventricosum]